MHLKAVFAFVGIASFIGVVVVLFFAGLILARGAIGLVVYRIRSRVREHCAPSELGLIVGFIAAAAVAAFGVVGTNLGTIIATDAL